MYRLVTGSSLAHPGLLFDVDVLADIDAEATTIKVAACMDIEVGVDAGISIEVDVRVDIEDEVEGEGPISLYDDEIMTITRSGMTPEVIEELINQRVAEVLAAYEANRVVELAVESQSQNGDDDGNKNGGGNGNGNCEGNGDKNGEGNGNRNGRGNGNGNPNRNDRGAMPVARECTYHHFIKCQPLNFKGTEGVVGLTRWFKKMETVFHISNYLERYQVKYATCTLLNSALTWCNAHKRTVGADAAFSKTYELQNYTQRFQEITMMCTKMVPEEEDRVKKFIRGLTPITSKGMFFYAVRKAKNMRRSLQRCVNNEKRGYAGPLPFCNKCKLHHEGKCTVRCSNCKKVGHMARDCEARVATTTRGAPEPNQKVVTCYECGRQGHYRSDCPKLKIITYGQDNKINKARGKSYGARRRIDNPDSMSFMRGNALFEVSPLTLDVNYASNKSLGKFQKQILCLEAIHYGDEVLIVQGDRSGEGRSRITKRKPKTSTEEKGELDVPICMRLTEVFPEDLTNYHHVDKIESKLT
ncbi:reverse transcriptase domain-containing protein [Tanacetum coccineum]